MGVQDFQNLEIQKKIQKMNIFWGYEYFKNIFWGSLQNWTGFMGHFYAF